jgi:hypothetical protein
MLADPESGLATFVQIILWHPSRYSFGTLVLYLLTFGVRPLKNAPGPSVRIMSRMTAIPEMLVLKLAFWIRVLTTSRGAATVMEATAPAIEATKSGR